MVTIEQNQALLEAQFRLAKLRYYLESRREPLELDDEKIFIDAIFHRISGSFEFGFLDGKWIIRDLQKSDLFDCYEDLIVGVVGRIKGLSRPS